MPTLIARSRRSRGQGNTEYVIIVALVAIATVGIVALFGDNIRRLFGADADALGGDTSIGNPAKSSTEAATTKNMSNFADQSTAYDPGGMQMMRAQSAGGASFAAGGAAAAASSK